MENNELFSPAPENRVSPPLFIRWGGDIIPTLPLVAALNALDLKPSDVRIIPGDTLFLGGKRSIPLDKNGRIPLAANSSPTILDTKEVIVPVKMCIRDRVYDGYARLEPEQADELLREWENISAHSIDVYKRQPVIQSAGLS